MFRLEKKKIEQNKGFSNSEFQCSPTLDTRARLCWRVNQMSKRSSLIEPRQTRARL